MLEDGTNTPRISKPVISRRRSFRKWSNRAIPPFATESHIYFQPMGEVGREAAGGFGIATFARLFDDAGPLLLDFCGNAAGRVPQRVIGGYLKQVGGLVSAAVEVNGQTVLGIGVGFRLPRCELVYAEDAKLLDGLDVPENGAATLAYLLGKGGSGWPGEAVARLGIEQVEDCFEGLFDLGRELAAGSDFAECSVAASGIYVGHGALSSVWIEHGADSPWTVDYGLPAPR